MMPFHKYFTSCFNTSLIGFGLSIIIPSTGVLYKYSGSLGLLIYLLFALSIVLFLPRYILLKYTDIVTGRHVVWLIVATLLILLIIFLVIYPIANSGLLGGGSDRDEGLNLATAELLKGRYPYYIKSPLNDNPISPLPGSLLLAIPFVLLGNSAYQNFFWLFIFFISMRYYLMSKQSALLLLWLILSLSPLVMQNFVTGSDLLTNSLYVTLFTLWMVNTVNKPNVKGWMKVFLAIMLGIGLSSRINFFVILPLVFSALVQRGGWKLSIKYVTIICLTFFLVTLPFYIYDPNGFSPLHVYGKLSQFHEVLPFAGIIIPLLTGFIALILSLSNKNRYTHNLFRNCAIILAFPALSMAVLGFTQYGLKSFPLMEFSLCFLFFGAVAYWSKFSNDLLFPGNNSDQG